MSAAERVVAPDATALAGVVADALVSAMAAAQAARGAAALVLTGGGIGTATLRALAERAESVDWSTVQLWWGDERYLPTGDPERNETGAREALIDALPIDPAQVHPVPGPDASTSVEEAAAYYARELADAGSGGLPVIDVVLLGVGPDAHIASLFPGHPALADDALAVPVHDSPKPPPTRVSLSRRSITAAREVWLLAAGAEKADAVLLAAGTEDPRVAPAGSVTGRERTVWFLDSAAAQRLPA
ncbi:6-phosphogluconolactonase [Motilibacter rhizosphaerae]|uniref:6-phosphogluconolactonase n=1 Tax=Motilibacter rhizosphaerae TaxID=598652 RepID=A0A4Q7NGA2_9ACTN|nr:6-phosphogluconolactonase [Motilibacter rhizosphaerae]RZS82814.1 6-phosphogluconolactonase [Motilibacter rhizosphaerae]